MVWFARHPFWVIFGVYGVLSGWYAYRAAEQFMQPFGDALSVYSIAWYFPFITSMAIALAVDRKWPHLTLPVGLVVFALLGMVVRSHIVLP